jgi:tRNA(Ile)-lysidine synthase
VGPPPEVAQVRRAVRESTADIGSGEVVLVAASGGPDSASLTLSAVHELPRRGVRVGLVTVDHGLQRGSAERARALAQQGRAMGMDPVEVVLVTVAGDGGPEAAARAARRRALSDVAMRHRARAVLLGHTEDDQAETVLLGLSRGSGARSLSGMSAESGIFRRPLLAVPRRVVHRALELSTSASPWSDPHNRDPRYLRARVRHGALPVLEATLGPGVAGALARSADMLRADADALDGWASAAMEQTRHDDGLGVTDLAALPAAVRTRVIRTFLLGCGAPAGALTRDHVNAVDSLVTGWRGQRGVDLPGGLRARRRDGRVVVEVSPRHGVPDTG